MTNRRRISCNSGAQPAQPKYRRLSAAERHQIANMRAAGHSNAEISRATGRSDGTITRELQRNSSPNNGAAARGAVSGGEAALVYCATRLMSRRARERWGIAHATRSRTSSCAATSRRRVAPPLRQVLRTLPLRADDLRVGRLR
ncbi:MAG: helix-turn-helix domain-containing protein [Solirubrobacteraceae bacterium]